MKNLKIMMISLLVFLYSSSVYAATFTVDIAADDADAHDTNPGDGICSDAVFSCTLRAAIEEANALAGADVIAFASTFNNATLVIDANEGPLPVISTQISIIGYSIDAYNSGATLLSDAPPQFTLDGSQLSSGNGLLFSGAGASGSVVSALGIVNFPSDGVTMALGADNIAINRSYIGIHPDGTISGNGGYGINAVITDDHKIGKTRHGNGTHFVSLGNVISANGVSGVRLFNSNDNVVNGNLIGLSATGSGDRGNDGYGIDISGNNNQIGDFINSLLAGNFIAANNSGGMRIEGDNNRVYTNHLGKGETGSFINSEGHGIEVLGDLNFIGNNDNGTNKIYEHVGSAIRLGQTSSTSANNNFIINNTIGSPGSAFPLLLSGSGNGIVVDNGDTNLIQGNRIINSGVVSGSGHGIDVKGDHTTVTGNQIGYVDYLGGVNSEPNAGMGVKIIGDNSIIGSQAHPNYVGGNGFTGVQVTGDDIKIEYNHIGVNETYDKIGNDASGLVVFYNGNGVEINHNVIGDNAGTGIYLVGDVNGQSIHHNYIGVSPNGANIGNDVSGIYLESVINADVWRNHIAHNGLDGITLVNGSEEVAIWQNYMYSNARLGIDLEGDGITVNDPGDIDEGENRLQNTPVIESILFNQAASPPTLTISYRVGTSGAAADYPMNIDFYWSPVDESPQGRHFIATDIGYNTPNMIRNVTIDFNSSALGGYLTATAIDQSKNTSEMAASVLFGESDLIFKDGFE